MPNVAPESYFDAIALLADAPRSVLPASVIELHLYAYLGCILGLFRGQAIGDWGYSFAVTSEGFPFSVEFEDGRRAVVGRSLAAENREGLVAPRTPEISDELEKLLLVGSWTQRRVWLRTATHCALALPVGSIRYAIAQSPGMSASMRLNQRRRLLQDDDVELLYDEYRVISSAFGRDVGDLLSPAVVWLSARILREEGAAVD